MSDFLKRVTESPSGVNLVLEYLSSKWASASTDAQYNCNTFLKSVWDYIPKELKEKCENHPMMPLTASK